MRRSARSRLIANQEKSLDSVALARALQGFALPADVALESCHTFFRARDHQLMSTILIGEVHPPRGDPFDVFSVRATIGGETAAEPAEASACRVAFPS